MKFSVFALLEFWHKFNFACVLLSPVGVPAKLYERDNPDWAPTQKMGHVSSKVDIDANSAAQRHERDLKRRRTAEAAEVMMMREQSHVAEDAEEEMPSCPISGESFIYICDISLNYYFGNFPKAPINIYLSNNS